MNRRMVILSKNIEFKTIDPIVKYKCNKCGYISIINTTRRDFYYNGSYICHNCYLKFISDNCGKMEKLMEDCDE